MNQLAEKENQQTVAGLPETNLKERLITDILSLGVQAHYRTERCVFVEFSGHVDYLFVSIRENVDEYKEELASTTILVEPYDYMTSTERDEFEQGIIDKLKETKRHLEVLIETGDIEGPFPFKSHMG